MSFKFQESRYNELRAWNENTGVVSFKGQMFSSIVGLTNSKTQIAPTAHAVVDVTTNDAFTVESDLASDSSGGTGARQLFLRCTNDSGGWVLKFPVMTGTTPVPLGSDISAINKAEVIDVGTGGVHAKANDGTIIFKKGGTTVLTIVAGANVSRQGYLNIPDGWRYIMQGLDIASDSKDLEVFVDQEFRFTSNPVNENLFSFYTTSEITLGSAPVTVNNGASTLIFSARTLSGTADVTIFVRGIFMKPP